MKIKENNEITVRIKGELQEFYKTIEENGFKAVCEFTMDDIYFIPKTLDINSTSTREILSKALIIRKVIGITSGKETKLITFKTKKFDKEGNILNQNSINCNVLDIEEAKKLLIAIGYCEIMYIKEKDIVYEKDRFQMAVKDIENGDKLIEIEETEEFNTIEILKEKINEYKIPIYTDDYFIKKAEIELDKVIHR